MNTDPRAIRIVNQFMRPGADQFVSMVFHAQALSQLAVVQDSAKVFSADKETVADGAEIDGRPQVTNADALKVFGATQALIVFATTPIDALGGVTPLEAFAKFAVNPR